VDDIDGSQAAVTVRFTYDGASYEIDLNQEHADKFDEAIGPYVQAARLLSRPRRPQPASPRRGRHDQSQVRAWAREQGLTVSERGRIPAEVLTRYEAAH
jgi:hypothetical protein